MQIKFHSSNVSGCPPLAAFYFFMQCNELPEIDIATQDHLESEIEGSTLSELNDNVAPRSSERKRAYAAIAEISETAKRIALEMEYKSLLI